MKCGFARLVGCISGVLTAVLLGAGCSPGGGSPANVGSVRILNALASDFESVQVYDAGGGIVHGADFACPAGQACVLLLPIDPDAQPLGYRFRDRLGRLVGASTASLAAETGYSIQVTADATGMDLFARLVEAGRFSASTMMHLIDAHVYKEFPAGSRPSLFADLAGHYQSALADSAYSEAQYVVDVLKAMGAQVPGGGTVPLDALRRPTPALNAAMTRSPFLVAAASVASTGSAALPTPCPSELTMLAGVIGGYGSAALTAASNPVFASVVGVTSSLVAGACTTMNTTARLNAISDKLDEIQSTLNSMNTQLGTIGIKLDLIAAQIADATLQASYSGFDSDQLNVDKVIKTYQGLLRPACSGNYCLQQFDNLNAYLLSPSGGFNQSTYSSNPALRSLLGDLKSHLDTYNRLLDVPRAMNIRDSISAMCQNAETIVGDIVARRNQCNALALAALGTSAASAQRLALVMDDLTNAIDAQFAAAAAAGDDAKTNWLRGVLVNNLYPSLTWQQTREQLKTDMLQSLDRFFSIVTPAIVDPLDGLPETLKTKLVDARCDKSTGGRSVAAIEAWVIQEAPGVASPDRYITVQCKGRELEYVYSRLYYRRDTGPNYAVLNVLGTLIRPNLSLPVFDSTFYKTSPTVQVGIQGDDNWACGIERNRCDIWIAVPGLTYISDGKGRSQRTPLRQSRSHTEPVPIFFFGAPTDGEAYVNTTDKFVYGGGTSIASPAQSVATSASAAYTDTPIQHFYTTISGTREDEWDTVRYAYLSYTWVIDLEGWLGKADPRYTRTVIFRVGYSQSIWTGGDQYLRFLNFWCVSADCNFTDPVSGWSQTYDTMTFESGGGPKFQWTPPAGERYTIHMVVDGRSIH